jgi:hypothetical protein
MPRHQGLNSLLQGTLRHHVRTCHHPSDPTWVPTNTLNISPSGEVLGRTNLPLSEHRRQNGRHTHQCCSSHTADQKCGQRILALPLQGNLLLLHSSRLLPSFRPPSDSLDDYFDCTSGSSVRLYLSSASRVPCALPRSFGMVQCGLLGARGSTGYDSSAVRRVSR